MNTKDLSIVTQVAGKIASDVVQSDTAIAAVRDGVFAEITETVLSSLLDAMNVSTATAPVVQLAPEAQGHDAAVQNVLNQFDGATVTNDETSVDYQPSPPTQAMPATTDQRGSDRSGGSRPQNPSRSHNHCVLDPPATAQVAECS